MKSLSDLTAARTAHILLAPILLLLLLASTTPAAAVATEPAEGPIAVEVGMMVDQVVNIDQRRESFTVAAHLLLRYRDTRLAYVRGPDDPPFRLLDPSAFLKLAQEHNARWPAFIYANLQGRIDFNQRVVRYFPSGKVQYQEIVTATLQAPDFDFRAFPFDHQVFRIHLRQLLDADEFVFVPLEDASGLGDKLGEEEWILANPQVRISTQATPAGELVSEFTLEFSGTRHLTYYILRIFIPMLIILTVSWATFQLKDYVKRVDMGITVLLLLIAFNFTLSTDLPRLGYITAMDAFMGGAFVITGAVALINVWFRRLQSNGHEDRVQRLDRYVIIFYWPLYVLGMSAALLML